MWRKGMATLPTYRTATAAAAAAAATVSAGRARALLPVSSCIRSPCYKLKATELRHTERTTASVFSCHHLRSHCSIHHRPYYQRIYGQCSSGARWRLTSRQQQQQYHHQQRCHEKQIHQRSYTTQAPPPPPPTPLTTTAARGSKTPYEVSDAEIVQLASTPLHPLSLSDLVRYGRPPLSPQALLSSARFTLSLLPSRLAHRLHAIRSLPYIVVSNPHISQIYANYLQSLSTLLPFYRSGIETAEDEAAFTEVLADLVQTHSNTIPVLARGLKECGKYLGDGEGRIGARFLDEHLRARIGTRLVAEQHLALHLASIRPHGDSRSAAAPSSQPDNFVGIIDMTLSPVGVLRQCEAFVGELCELKYGVRPNLVLNGDLDARIAHLPTHLEYVLTELLKNAFRATIENGRERDPIEVTIALDCELPANNAAPFIAGLPGQRLDPVAAPGGVEREGGISQDMYRPVMYTTAENDRDDHNNEQGSAFKMATNPTASLTIRIRDRGGGIPPEVLPRVWEYSFSTFDDDQHGGSAGGGGGLATLSAAGADGGGTIAGLGYGLPLGRAYAEHFGGELNVESLWGWGTDVYLRLKGLDTGIPGIP